MDRETGVLLWGHKELDTSELNWETDYQLKLRWLFSLNGMWTSTLSCQLTCVTDMGAVFL